MTEPARRRRGWFSYSLRTFFVVLTILGVWLGVQVKWIRDRHAALEWVEAVNSRPISTAPGADWVSMEVRYQWTNELVVPAPWQIRMLGEDGVAEIHVNRSQTSASDQLD